MQIPLNDIVVKKRIRKEMGDIVALAESMKRYGQMNPIVLNSRNQLISGGRRLEAARYLGWRTINAVILDINESLSILEYEVEENVRRQNFSAEELAQAARRLNRLRNPGFFRRILNAFLRFFRKLFKTKG
ncbi:MAG: ParB N-terminal domain-containing protein [Treponema sp.]|nr:ParB N-terminal domain-containing protein [Treponema sp.]